ncbi:hypothetical protein [Propioniciclava tarda]|uniref:Uncharacterized protein n=1 Tax=Propioniciclava tarda TaxID=433330 RepID=A0A4Q9KM60_PROTD|nr:hypothetical protein [Propioniciclava tarda]TBT95040.1 hypothetical protein ET996_07140 [Propioniciclava tarda]SMO54348.1 hypothetical protein SAMN06266982_10634 [Propioniciclava tarda]
MTNALAPGFLAPTPTQAPPWRRGSWPVWIAAVIWVLLFVRDVPSLVQGLLGEQPLLSTGAVTLLGLVLLFLAALAVAALAPGRLTAGHLGL